MGVLMNHLFFLITFFTEVCKISTTDILTSANDNQWTPVFKLKNSTREWKILEKDEASLSEDQDTLGTAKFHHNSLHLPSIHHGSLPSDHDLVHHLHHEHNQLPHQENYYETSLQSVPRYDPTADSDGYYYPSYAPGLPPIYGPPPPGMPPTPYPEESVHIMVALERLVIQCVAKDPLEHIVWTRFPCPNEYFYGNGQVIAEGSKVYDTDLYDVRITGESGDTSSELLLKSPLDSNTSGLYICEAWPYHKKPEYPYKPPHPPSPTYPSLSDAFVIGGGELVDQCYFNHKQPFLFRKRYHANSDRHDQPLPHSATELSKANKILIKKQGDSFADRMRKPRNITAYSLKRQEKALINDDIKELTTMDFNEKLKKSPFYPTPKEHRYDFKLDNNTSILNASAIDVLKNITKAKTNSVRQLISNRSKNFAINVNRSLNFTNFPTENSSIKSSQNDSNLLFSGRRKIFPAINVSRSLNFSNISGNNSSLNQFQGHYNSLKDKIKFESSVIDFKSNLTHSNETFNILYVGNITDKTDKKTDRSFVWSNKE